MRRVTITNTGTNAITLLNQSSSSAAANRFIIPGVSGKVIPRTRERPVTKKGNASDVGMLGTKRNFFGKRIDKLSDAEYLNIRMEVAGQENRMSK